MSDIVGACRQRALALLRAGATPHGFAAAVGDDHYGGVWARDALITGWGALATGEPDLAETTAATLRTLAAHQAPRGQIPAVAWPARGWWDWGDAGATDAAALFALTCCAHHDTTGDEETWRALQPACDLALGWLAAQDPANWGLVDSPPAADWMDSTFNRGGKVLSVNAIYAGALRLRERRDPEPAGLPGGEATVRKVDLMFWPDPTADTRALLDHVQHPADAAPPRPHPVMEAAYRRAARADRATYCSHVTYGRFAEGVDVLGNVLAVLLGVASAERAARVLAALDAADVASPHPARAWAVPATADDDPWRLWDREAEDLQDERWRNAPNRYHNAGVWPFIGGLLTAAHAAAGSDRRARELLAATAGANALADWGFVEWIDAASGEPAGTRGQVWSAGAFLLADAACAGGRSPLGP